MSIYKCAFFLALLIGVNAFNVSASYAGMGVNPSSLNFGAVNVKTASLPGVITLTNYGKHEIRIVQASSNLPEFLLASPTKIPASCWRLERYVFRVCRN